MIGERLRPIPSAPFPVRGQLPRQVVHREQRPPHPRRPELPPHGRDIGVDPGAQVHRALPQRQPRERNRPLQPRPRLRRPEPRPRLRRGDLLPIGLIWYAIVRFVLENLRTGNWKLEGIATAQLFSIAFVIVAVALLAYRHRTAPPDEMVGVPASAGPHDADSQDDEDMAEADDADDVDDGDRVSAAVKPPPPADAEPLT